MLVLDGAAAPARAALGTTVIACEASGLPLAVAGLDLSGITAIAVTVGPGSFTGLRAALSLAHGLALAGGWTLIPVTLAEAFRADLPEIDPARLWIVLDTRRSRVFLDRGAGPVAVMDLPLPDGPITLVGDAAPASAAWLAERGAAVTLGDLRRPTPAGIARAAARRRAGDLPPLAALPLYVDPPEATPARLRPPPIAQPGETAWT